MPDPAPLTLDEWRRRKAAPRAPSFVGRTVEEIADSPEFSTPLSPADETRFAEWKRVHAPEDSGYDYDLRGAFKAGVTPDPVSRHWPDTYKKPNHPTFSDQSQYAATVPERAGRWEGETYIPPQNDAPVRTYRVDVPAAAPSGGMTLDAWRASKGPASGAENARTFFVKPDEERPNYEQMQASMLRTAASGGERGSPVRGAVPLDAERRAQGREAVESEGFDPDTGAPMTPWQIALSAARGYPRRLGEAVDLTEPMRTAAEHADKGGSPLLEGMAGGANTALKALTLPVAPLLAIPGTSEAVSPLLSAPGRGAARVAEMAGAPESGQRAAEAAANVALLRAAPAAAGKVGGVIRDARISRALAAETPTLPAAPKPRVQLLTRPPERAAPVAPEPAPPVVAQPKPGGRVARDIARPAPVAETTAPAIRPKASMSLEDWRAQKAAPTPPADAATAQPPAPREGPTLGSGLGAAEALLAEPKPKPFSADPKAQAAFDRVSERINSKPETAPLSERVAEGAKGAYQKFVRDEAPLARMERDLAGKLDETGPTAYAKEAQGSAPRKQHNLETAGVIEGHEVPDTVKAALSEVPQAQMRELSAYMTAKRFSTKYDPNKFESGVDPAHSAEVVRAVEADPAKAPIVRAAKAMHEYDRALLRNLAEADRWTPDRLKSIEEANPYYTQILREMEKGGGKGGAVTTGPMQNQGVKPVTGGAQPIRDPVLLFRERGQRMVAAADKARLKHRILDFATEHGERAKAWIEEIDVKKAKRELPDYDAIMDAVGGIERGTATPDQVATYVSKYLEGSSGDVMATVRNGKLAVYKVHDPLLAEYLRGETSPNSFGWKVYEKLLARPASKITGIQRLGTTAARPEFALPAFWRDVKTYYTLTEAGPVRATTSLVRGVYHAVRGTLAEASPKLPGDTSWSRLYKRLGTEGMIGSDQMATRRAVAQYAKRTLPETVRAYARQPWAIVGDGVGRAVNGVRTVVGTLESAPRIAETINAAKRLGVTPDKPMTTGQRVALSNRAGEITVNFRLGGKVSKQLNRFQAFFNARLQGAENVRQAWIANPKRMAVRTMAYSVLPEVGLWAYVMADEERRKAYLDMPVWRRNGFTNLPYTGDDGKTHFLSLPMVAEIDLPARAVRAALDLWATGNEAEAMEAARDMAAGLSPVGGGNVTDILTPSVVQPIADVTNKRSEFTGRPINPKGTEGMEKWAPEEVASANTSGLAKRISGILATVGSELTAAEVDHLIRGYAGPVTRDVAKFDTDPAEAADAPIVGRFFGRESESATVDRFYDVAAKVEGRRTASLRTRESAPDKSEEFATPPKLIGALSKIKEAINGLRDEYRAATSTEARRKLSDEMKELAAAGLEMAEPWSVPGVPTK